jgi:hypothetical protein
MESSPESTISALTAATVGCEAPVCNPIRRLLAVESTSRAALNVSRFDCSGAGIIGKVAAVSGSSVVPMREIVDWPTGKDGARTAQTQRIDTTWKRTKARA